MKRIIIRVVLLLALLFNFLSVHAQNAVYDWAYHFGTNSINYTSKITHVETDTKGNIYAAGIYTGTVDFDPGPGTANATSLASDDIFILKLDSTGAYQWVSTFDGTGIEHPKALTIDVSGNVYLAGNFSGTVDFDPGPGTANKTAPGCNCNFIPTDGFILKLNQNGNYVWSKFLIGNPWEDDPNDIAVDNNKNIIVTGEFRDTVDFDPGPGTFYLNTKGGFYNYFILKLDSVGNFLWAHDFDNHTISAITSRGIGVTVNHSGEIFTTGNFHESLDFDPGPDTNMLYRDSGGAFINKFSANGDFLWAKNFNVSWVRDITLDPFGDLLLAGEAGSGDVDPGPGVVTLPQRDRIRVLKFSQSGTLLWAKAMGGGGSHSFGDIPMAITSDRYGNVYHTGSFDDTSDFDPGPGILNLTAPAFSHNHTYIQKLDINGNLVWVTQLKSSANSGLGIATGLAGQVYGVGEFEGTVDFDPGSGTQSLAPSLGDVGHGTIEDNGYILKYTQTGITCQPPGNNGQIAVSQIKQDSAFVTWYRSSSNTSGGYSVKVTAANAGTQGAAVYTASTIPTDTSDWLTGLTANTSYDVYLRTDCDKNDTSAWQGPETFTTLPVCNAPTNIQINNINNSEVRVTWTGSSNAPIEEYRVQLVPQGSGLGNSVIYQDTSGNGINTELINGLAPVTSYDLYLRSECNPGDLSTWSGPHNFTTLPICDPPSQLNSQVFSSSSATVTWNASPSNPSNGYFVKVVAQGALVSATAAFSGSTSSGDTDINALGLGANTAYDAYVKSVCGASDSSTWLGPTGFTTLPECNVPTNLQATVISDSEVDVSWNASTSSVNGYELEVVPQGNGIGNGVLFSTSTAANVTTATITGLSATTSYDVYIRATCTGNNGTWILPVSFTTLSTCDVPSALNVSVASNSSATVSWTAPPNAPANGYAVDIVPTGNAPETGTVSSTTVGAGVTSALLSGLSSGTGYDVYVRSVCGNRYVSNWTGPSTFSICTAPTNLSATALSGSTALIEWHLSTSAPGGGYEVNIVPDGNAASVGAVFSGTNLSGNSTLNATGLTAGTDYDVYVRADCGSGYHSSWTGPTDLRLCDVPKNLAATVVNNVSANLSWHLPAVSPANGFEVKVVTSGSGVSAAAVFSGTNPAGDSTISATGLSSQTAYDFYVRSICGPGDNSVWIGPTNFTTFSACSEPTKLAVSSLNASQVNAIWNASHSNPANGYAVNVVAAGNAPGNSPVFSSTTSAGDTTITVSGLSTGTSYDLYVKAVCGNNYESGWRGPFNFSICEVPTIVTAVATTANLALITWKTPTSEPSEGFEIQVVSSGSSPGTNVAASGFTNQGDSTFTATGLTSGASYDVYVRSRCGSGNQSSWSSPRGISQPASGSCTYTFEASGSDFMTADVDITIGSTTYSPGPGMSFQTVFHYTASTNDTIIINVISAGGGFFGGGGLGGGGFGSNFAFSFKDPSGKVLYSDGPNATTGVVYNGKGDCAQCFPPSEFSSSTNGNTAVSLSWDISVSEPANGYEIEIVSRGNSVGSGTVYADTSGVSQFEENISSLAAGSYDAWIRSACGSNDFSDWLGPESFTLGANYTYDGSSWFPSNPDGASGNQDVIIINAGAAQFTSNTTCRKIIIEPGASLEITLGNSLSVADTALLRANGSGYAQLLGATSGGTYIVQSHLQSSSARWFNVASPISGGTVADFQVSSGSIVTSSQGTANQVNLWYFDPATLDNSTGEGTWLRVADETQSTDGVGFSLYLGPPWFGSFPITLEAVGNGLNNGNKSISLDARNGGWNFVANPYPSALDWNSFYHGGATNINPTIYIDNEGSFASYDASTDLGLNSGGSYIAPMQAFFVKATSNTSLGFNNSYRNWGQNPVKLKTNPIALKLSVYSSASSLIDETALAFAASYLNTAEAEKDALKQMNYAQGVPNLYTADSLGEYYAINKLNDDFRELVVPLSFENDTGGVHRLRVERSSLPGGWQVELQDHFAGVRHSLSKSDYQFNHATGAQPERFSLIIKKDPGMELNAPGRPENVYAFLSGHSLMVNLEALQEYALLEVYDLSGRCVIRQHAAPAETQELDLSDLPKGMYILKVSQDSNLIHTQKFTH